MRLQNQISSQYVSIALAAAATIPNLRTEIHGYIMWIGLDLDEVVLSVYQTCMRNAGV